MLTFSNMQKKVNIIILVISIIFILYLGINIIDKIGYKCPFKYLFNIYCAGCGTTRMMKEIFKLNFYKAFRYNPLMFILLIIGIIYFIYVCICYIKNIKIIKPKLKHFYILIIILIMYTILRNISYFKVLRP